MKKSFLSILAMLLLVFLMLSCFSACSKIRKKKESASKIQIGTLESTEHLETESHSESISDTAAIESESVEGKPTELPTEPPSESESETEAETEPAPSLEYLSFGNGTCEVVGIGSYADAYVIIPEKSPQGDVVISIGEKAFFENSVIKAIQIPSTLMNIGNMAFSNCTSLVYIYVDTANMMFTDVNGVLYSKDKTKLLVYPCASLASEIFISSSVTEIADLAFFSTPNLKFIKYGGTLSDWSQVKIGDKNYGLYSASLSFTVTE